jgi:hypothetical protein
MSYFDDASLVFIPSGTKASKVYSVKPIDGTGDLTFTRSNDTASRVASNGLIERVRTNLLPYSNDFSNAAWTKTNGGVGIAPVVTPNYTTDPFGGNNGWRLQCDLNGGTTSSDRSWLQQIFAGTTVPTTASVYAKLNSAGTATFAVTNGSTDNVTITSTDWVRVSSVRTAAPSSYIFRIGLIGGNSQSDSIDISIAFAQLETGDIATPYIGPTLAAAVSVGPVANVPRLDYLGSSCPRLLLEPQRQNLALFSESFDNAGWAKQNATITANQTTSPSGYVDADLYTTTGTSDYAQQGVSGTSGTAYTISCFVKNGNANSVGIVFTGAAYPVAAIAEFNLLTETSSVTAGTATASIQNYGNGWYRIVATSTAGATGTINARIISLSGSAVSTFYVWGAQVEAGTYGTSYIPTLGASVTRGADAASKTGISSLIGQTEGTIFFDITLDQRIDFSYFVIAPNLGSTGAYIGVAIEDTKLQAEVINSGAQAIIPFTNSSTGRFKGALAYKANDVAFYVNGTLVGTDTSATIPACSQFALNNYDKEAAPKYNQALVFKTRLTNAQLAELTTL